MTVVGPSDKIASLSQMLDPKLLAELAADILATLGYTDIKIVDGPGDGCRDIHALDAHSEKTLVQCKFHKDVTKTVSSKEIGELPMGMVKFDYKKGIFVTNAQVSPQAKREYLDNYNNLDLDYWDGRALVEHMFGNTILKALWFDGEEIGRVCNALVIPIIARNLENDKAVKIVDELDIKFTEHLCGHLKSEHGYLDFAIRPESPTSLSIFSPYRSPTVRTPHEGMLTDIKATEIVVTGVLPLEKLEEFLRGLAVSLLNFVESNHHLKKIFCIRLGTPSLTPLRGTSAGVRLQVDVKPFTFIKTQNQTYDEREWLIPSKELALLEPQYVRGSQYNQTRLYSQLIDACIDCLLLSPPSEQTRQQIEVQRDSFIWYWERSLFALLSNNSLSAAPLLPEADYSFEWIGGRVFKGWLHIHLSRGLFLTPTDDPDSEDHGILSGPFQEVHDYEQDLKELRRVIKILGGEIIPPQRARYMVASVLNNPFPSEDKIIYGMGDLLVYQEAIPSPVNPKARYLEMTVCWKLGTKDTKISEDIHNGLEQMVRESLEREFVHVVGRIEVKLATFYREPYAVLYLEEPIGFDEYAHIDARVKRFIEIIDPVLQRVEKNIQDVVPEARRATREFWKSEYDMPF